MRERLSKAVHTGALLGMLAAAAPSCQAEAQEAEIRIKSLKTDAGVIVEAPIVDPRKAEERHARDIEQERSTALAGMVLVGLVMFAFGRASVRVAP